MIENFESSLSLKDKFNDLIPGGSHTYSKGDDQFPQFASPYIVRGKGCHVWDMDGNEYIEYGCGLRSVTLGHAYDPVIEAAAEQMRFGTNFGRPSPIEVECAEQFLSMITRADMVKFAKNGSDATTGAVKLARAYTGRDMVAMCENMPFFSVDDWFIGKTAINAGIPQVIQDLSIKFRYNDIESLRKVFETYPNQIACIIMELERIDEPEPGYLQAAIDLCHEHGAVFIADEIVTGFRWHNGGAQAYHDVVPDLSCFAKAMGNGFAISALAGKREIMEMGGLQHTDRERVFLLSTTYGAETHALAATMATMRIYRDEDVIGHLFRQGKKLREGVQSSIDHFGLDGYFAVYGKDCSLFFGTRGLDKKPSQAYRTLFLQELLKRGIMAPSFIMSYSHSDEDIERTIEIVHDCLDVYKKAIEEGVEKYLLGRAVQPVYRKYN